MWQAIVGGVSTLFSSWIGYKSKKMEAQAVKEEKIIQGELDYDTEAQRQMQHSWKDELMMIIWLSPMYVAWFYPNRARDWIELVSQFPEWWWFGAFGMMAATFGLRWYFKGKELNK